MLETVARNIKWSMTESWMFTLNDPFSVCVSDKVSMSGFNQEKVRVVYYRALYPFEARSHDEISIQPGDIVMVSRF